MFDRISSYLSSFLGTPFQINDVLKEPLKEQEILLTNNGKFYKVHVPKPDSPLITRLLFQIQIYINTKGFLQAIPNLIESFAQSLERHAIENQEDLEKMIRRADHLNQLKSNYENVKVLTGTISKSKMNPVTELEQGLLIQTPLGLKVSTFSQQIEHVFEKIQSKQENYEKLEEFRKAEMLAEQGRQQQEQAHQAFQVFKNDAEQLLKKMDETFNQVHSLSAKLITSHEEAVKEIVNQLFLSFDHSLEEIKRLTNGKFKKGQEHLEKRGDIVVKMHPFLQRYRLKINYKLDQFKHFFEVFESKLKDHEKNYPGHTLTTTRSLNNLKQKYELVDEIKENLTNSRLS